MSPSPRLSKEPSQGKTSSNSCDGTPHHAILLWWNPSPRNLRNFHVGHTGGAPLRKRPTHWDYKWCSKFPSRRVVPIETSRPTVQTLFEPGQAVSGAPAGTTGVISLPARRCHWQCWKCCFKFWGSLIMLLPTGETLEQQGTSNQTGSSSEATVLVQIMHNLLTAWKT